MTAWQGASDAELISAVRGDELAAWAELCRRHLEAARRLALTLVPAKAADVLVARVAERVLAELRAGEGPDLAFRTYLLKGVRDEQRSSAGPLHAVPSVGGSETHDPRPAVRAFRTLPERWQLVLWHVDVERDQPAQVAPLIGAAARSVPAIAGRARAGLGAATLELHAWEADEPHQDCAWTRDHLLAYVRHGATRREAGRVSSHLQGCPPCSSVHAELVGVDDDLAGILGPLVLGTAAADYLSPRKAGLVARHPGAAALAGVAAALVLITGVAVGLSGSTDGPPVAEAPLPESARGASQAVVKGAVLEQLTQGEPDDESSPTTPGSASSSAPPVSSPPPSGSPSDDPTTSSPEADLTAPPTSTPPTTTPPPTTPASPIDPAVTARELRTTGPLAGIQVLIKDAAGTDGRLTVVAPDNPDVEFFLNGPCAPLEGGMRSSVCELPEDATVVELFADLRGAEGFTSIEVGITPRRGVETTPGLSYNNTVNVSLPPPPHED